MANTKIPSELVAINAISGTLIADNAITSVHIAQNNITATQIAINAVTALQMADGTITSAKIADGTIVTADIAEGQITTSKLADSAVTTGKIAAGTIVAGDIANNAIHTQHIDDNQITADQIADNAVGIGQLAGIARGKIIVGDSAGNPALLALGAANTLLQSDGTDIVFAPLQSGIDDNSNAVAITIDSSENVGIGTTSPGNYYAGAEQLVVAKASGEGGITIATAANTSGALYFADGTSGSQAYMGGMAYAHGTDVLTLVSGGVARVNIATAGHLYPNVNNAMDLGLTNNKWKDLRLSGLAYTDKVVTQTIFREGSDGSGLHFTTNAIYPTNQTSAISNGTEDLGSSNYRFKDLHLSGTISSGAITATAANSFFRDDDNVGIQLQTTAQGTGGSDGVRLGLNGTHAFIWNYEAKPLAFATSGTERLSISATGPFDFKTNNLTNIGAITINNNNDTYNFKAMAGDTDSWFGVYDDANNSANIIVTRSDGATSFRHLGHSGATIVSGTLSSGAITSTGLNSTSGTVQYTDGGSAFDSSDASGYARFTVTNGSAQIGLFRAGSSAGGSYIGADSGKLLRVYNSSFAPKFDIDTSGNVLSEGYLRTKQYFQVFEGTSQVGFIGKEKSIVGSGSSLDMCFFAESVSGGGDIHFMTGGASTKRLTVLANGKVGLGKDVPTSQLHIKAATNGYDGGILIEDTDSTTKSAITHVNGGLYLSSNATNDHLFITSAGDILIGNTTVQPSSQHNNQAGFGYDVSTAQLQIASTSNNAQMELSRNSSSDGNWVTFRKQSNVLGNIGTYGGTLYIGSTAGGLMFNGADCEPTSGGATRVTNTVSLGSTNYRFKDIHLHGNVAAHGGAFVIATDGAGSYLGKTDNSTLRIVTANATRMTVTNTGIVGVGGASTKSMHGTSTSGATTMAVAGPIGSGYAMGEATSNIPRIYRDWFVYATTSSATHKYVHMKTDIWAGGASAGNIHYTMSCFTYNNYYAYGGAQGQGSIGWHNWAGSFYNIQRINNGSLQLVQNSYVSSDGYVVLVALIGGGYAQFSIDWSQWAGYPFQEKRVTATSRTSSANGAY